MPSPLWSASARSDVRRAQRSRRTSFAVAYKEATTPNAAGPNKRRKSLAEEGGSAEAFAGIARLADAGILGVGGEHDDGELLVGVLGSQMSQGSKAIEPWHVDVEEHQVHGFRGHGLNGFGATVHGQGCVAYFLEFGGNDDPVGVTVIDDENGSKLTHNALVHRDGTMPSPLSQYSRF